MLRFEIITLQCLNRSTISSSLSHIPTPREGTLPHHSLLLLFTFLWGANFILAEVALLEMAPISFSVSRFVMGGVAMLSIMYWQSNGRDSFFPKLQKKDWPRLLVVSVIGATLAPWLGIEGLGQTHGARASLWLALGPVMSTYIGFLLGTEIIGKYGYIGAVLAGLGTFILAADGIFNGQGYWVGDLLLLAALVLTIVELHLIKPLARKYGSVSMVAMRTVIGGSLYLLIASPTLAQEPWLNLTMWIWIAIFAGGAIGVGVGQWVKVRALHKLGPTQVVIYGNLVPLAALWISWLFLQTDPSRLELLACFLIITGAISVQLLDKKAKPLSDDTNYPVVS